MSDKPQTELITTISASIVEIVEALEQINGHMLTALSATMEILERLQESEDEV